MLFALATRQMISASQLNELLSKLHQGSQEKTRLHREKMGPIVLFDKSFIEMLNLDEAAIFDFMFMSNICPIYFTEVLADLEKEKPGERTREKVVADVANKTPSVHSYPNVLHASICMRELAGYAVEMDGRPIVGGGQPVRVAGKVGVYYEESPEMKAFNRWQAHKFFEVEREFARDWRAQLTQADLTRPQRSRIAPCKSDRKQEIPSHADQIAIKVYCFRRPRPIPHFQGGISPAGDATPALAENDCSMEGGRRSAPRDLRSLHGLLPACGHVLSYRRCEEG